MSSMRNAVQRRNHKERSQVSGREKWGMLEKHKDYSLRAADYNLKKKKLSILDQKARERNPDEFAFGMLSAEKSKQGKHGKNSLENRLSHETVQLLKTQDQGYLRTIGQKNQRELEELEQEIKLAETVERTNDADQDEDEDEEDDFDDDDDMDIPTSRARSKPGKKIVFVDPNDPTSAPPLSSTSKPILNNDIDAANSSEEEENANHSSQAQKKTTKPDSLSRLRALRKRRKRLNEYRASKLRALKTRQKEIKSAIEALEAQRARMTNKAGGVNKAGVKFKVRERKR